MRDFPGQEGPMVDWPRVEAMPGARVALDAFSQVAVQCVATNATESDGAAVARALDRVGLREGLTHFLTSRELGASKPDPRFFLEASRRLGLPPEALVSIGNDYRKDVAPAKEAGFSTVLVSADAGPGPFDAADLVVRELRELAARIQL